MGVREKERNSRIERALDRRSELLAGAPEWRIRAGRTEGDEEAESRGKAVDRERHVEKRRAEAGLSPTFSLVAT
jgi:hypothetical protein